jgi:DNA invertase Pin-like site-specific DNA recombinase
VRRTKRRAIAYVRVSTVEQISGFGLDVQEKAIRDYARDHGIRVLDIARDEGVSGTKGEEGRPGLAEALVRLEAGEAEVLLVARADRLARDLILQETVIRDLKRWERDIVSVAEPDLVAEDGQRTLIRQILGAVSQYEGWLIAARLRAGREMKRARGGYAAGRPPYGYRANRGALEPLPQEQEAISVAKELRRRGMSLRQIAQRLTQEGHRPKGGGVWHPPQIARLLQPPRQPSS